MQTARKSTPTNRTITKCPRTHIYWNKQISATTEKCLSEQVLQNVNQFIKSTKKKRTNGARRVVAIIPASVSGEIISLSKDNLNMS